MDGSETSVLELDRLRTLPTLFERAKARLPDWIRRLFPVAQRPPLLRIEGGLRLQAGVTLVIGTSGSGKSVFLSFLSGYPLAGTRMEGSVRIGGRAKRIPVAKMGEVYRSMPCIYLPQRFPEVPRGTMTVKKLMLGVTEAYRPFMKLKVMSKREGRIKQSLKAHLKRNGLDHLWERDIASLSGGERQRIEFLTRLAILSHLEANQSILILDEPTTGLDPKNAKDFLSEVAKAHAGLKGDKRCAIVIATHSPGAMPNSLNVPVVVIRNHTAPDIDEYRVIDVTQYDTIRAFLPNRDKVATEGAAWDIAYDILMQEGEWERAARD